MLTLKNMGGTLMGCSGLPGEVEQAVFSLDHRRVRWDVEGDRLSLEAPGGYRFVFVADSAAPVPSDEQVVYDGHPDGRAHVFTLRSDGSYLIGDWYFRQGRGRQWSIESSFLSDKSRRLALDVSAVGGLREGEVLLGGFAPARTVGVEYRATVDAEPVALTVHDDRGTRWAPFHGWAPAGGNGTVTAVDPTGRPLATCTFHGDRCRQPEGAPSG